MADENRSSQDGEKQNYYQCTFIARRIEIEMRITLGEQTDLKSIESKHNILL